MSQGETLNELKSPLTISCFVCAVLVIMILGYVILSVKSTTDQKAIDHKAILNHVKNGDYSSDLFLSLEEKYIIPHITSIKEYQKCEKDISPLHYICYKILGILTSKYRPFFNIKQIERIYITLDDYEKLNMVNVKVIN